MALAPHAAERLLRARFGDPINPVPNGARAGKNNDKVLGFATPEGRVSALDRKIQADAHIWFEPPSPPPMDGVVLRPTAPINANLSGRRAGSIPPEAGPARAANSRPPAPS